MVKEVVMPKLGMTMKEGMIAAWYKHEGDPISKGEVLASIHSEKIEMDLEAPEAGKILKIEIEENHEVPPGTVICYIGDPSEKKQESTTSQFVPNVENVHLDSVVSQGQSKLASERQMVQDLSIKISPVARKMAMAAGVDMNDLIGTGPGGRITKQDVEMAISQPSLKGKQQQKQVKVDEATTELIQEIPPTHETSLADINAELSRTVLPMPETIQDFTVTNDRDHQKIVPIQGIRKTIAQRMLNSIQNTAQLTLFAKADVTELKLLQQQISPAEQNLFDEKVSITAFIARAVVLSLQQHKQMNCAMVDNHFHMNKHVHLGIAVALENGLIVPVIRNAEQSSIKFIAKSIKTLTQRAHNGVLRSEEIQGSTFTITNLGNAGVEYFTPILNTPESGILGVGSIKDEPVFVGEELKRRSLLPLSLTFDHRVLDGAPAAAFLHSVKKYLEKPLSLLI